MIRNTTDFINEFVKKWGSENFDFSETVYVNQKTPLTVICKIHGPITKTPSAFLKLACFECDKEEKRKAQEQAFLEKAKSIHGDKYCYDKVHYINADTEVIIICNRCKEEFSITPRYFYNIKQCPVCKDGNRLFVEDCLTFLKEKFSQFGNKYSFEVINPPLGRFVDNETIIRTYCPEHGITDRAWIRIKDKGLLYPCIKCSPTGYNWSMERFIKESTQKWEGKYDYSLINESNWVDMETPVPIICPIHGLFYQKPRIHIRHAVHGCPQCAQESEALTTEEFIKRAKEVHGDRYDYSETVYVNSRTKIKIFCKTCQEYFWQLPYNHLNGQQHNSTKCNPNATPPLTFEVFVERSRAVHGDKYDYSLAEAQFDGSEVPVELICRNCGEHFWVIPYRHYLRGAGCTNCSRRINNTAEFIEEAKKVHGDLYTYEKTVYEKMQGIITVTCPRCGDFSIKAVDFLRGSGCNCCKMSTNENFTEEALTQLKEFFNINFERFKRFEDLRGKGDKKLEFDFYLPDLNTLIEYQGEQHYRPVQYMGCSLEEAEQNFKDQLIRDQMKRDYCEEKGYYLMEIPFDVKGVENIRNFIEFYLKENVLI